MRCLGNVAIVARAAAVVALRCVMDVGPRCLAARGQCPMARRAGQVPARRPCVARLCLDPWEAPEASQVEVGAPLFTHLHTEDIAQPGASIHYHSCLFGALCEPAHAFAHQE